MQDERRLATTIELQRTLDRPDADGQRLLARDNGDLLALQNLEAGSRLGRAIGRAARIPAISKRSGSTALEVMIGDGLGNW
jgi:hypothetical protein